MVASGFVDLSSAQTILGAKSFSVSPSFPAGISTAGEVDSGTLTVAGLASLNGGLVLPSSFGPTPTFAAGVLSINLQSVSFLTLAYTMTADINSIVITNALVGGMYRLFLSPSTPAKKVKKALGANIFSTLSGDTSIASKWIVCISHDGTNCLLDFNNYT